MLVYVDESGDTGLHLDKGASPYFIVSAVIFSCPLEAERCSNAIDGFRNQIGKKNLEFKFSKLNSKNRKHFLLTIAQFDFKYCAVILDKNRLYGKGFKFHRSFYKYSIRLLFQHAKRHMLDAAVCIDECGNDEFRQELEKYLDRQINSDTPDDSIKSVSMEDSRSENLLQMVDLVCGAVARSLKPDKTDHRDYRPHIIQKEAAFQVWPNRKRESRPKKSK